MFGHSGSGIGIPKRNVIADAKLLINLRYSYVRGVITKQGIDTARQGATHTYGVVVIMCVFLLSTSSWCRCFFFYRNFWFDERYIRVHSMFAVWGEIVWRLVSGMITSVFPPNEECGIRRMWHLSKRWHSWRLKHVPCVGVRLRRTYLQSATVVGCQPSFWNSWALVIWDHSPWDICTKKFSMNKKNSIHPKNRRFAKKNHQFIQKSSPIITAVVLAKIVVEPGGSFHLRPHARQSGSIEYAHLDD